MSGTTSECTQATGGGALDAYPKAEAKRFQGMRAIAVLFSHYPDDPRPRRAAEALVSEGMSVEVICLKETADQPARESFEGVDITRIPLKRRRGGKLTYILQYAWFILLSGAILAFRSCRCRYRLVHIHNMPDILVFSALVPKALGAKVVLDLHDPMPELMMGIFGMERERLGVRMLEWLEKRSIGFADFVLTPNNAFQRLFTSRSCPSEKIGVVMNSPDEKIFPFRESSRREEAKPESGPFVIMYHGALVERHGLDIAVEALHRMRSVVPHAELHICGAVTPFLEKVLELAKTLELEGAVKYLGQKSLEQIVEEIDRCNVGIIPNRRSPFTEINMPTRIFEYLARGKPVIAPRTVGICDYFAEDQIVFFEPGDPDELASKLQWVFSQRHVTGEYVKLGQHIYQNHQWREERARFIGMVSRLVHQHQP